MQEDHGVAGANMEQDNRYVDTSDDDEIPDIVSVSEILQIK